MARPSRCRRICSEPAYESFIPEGIPCQGQVILTLDEYEVIRLIDLEKLTHEQCARQMDISRTTVTEIYEAAREARLFPTAGRYAAGHRRIRKFRRKERMK